MTSQSPRKRRTTAFPRTPRRTAISLAVLAGVAGAAFGQQPAVVPPAVPAPPPTTQWTPLGQPPAVAPPSAPPGLVPKTLTFQKESGTSAPTPPAVPPLTFQKGAGETVPMLPPTVDVPSLPPLGVPATPVKMVRDPQTPKADDEATRKDVPKAQDKQPELTKGTLPTRGNVFRLTSDTDLNARIQQELGNRKDPFPNAAPLSTEPLVYQPKTASYPPMKRDREPNYVVHRRLYFEEKNSERAGWEMGFLQPFVSASYFYKDVFFLPHNVASGVFRNRWDTSAGKCMPGSPTPYYLYPQGFTVSGLMFQATLLTGLPFIFPG